MLGAIRRFIILHALFHGLAWAASHSFPLRPMPAPSHSPGLQIPRGGSLLKSLKRAGIPATSKLLADIQRLNHLGCLDTIRPGRLLLPAPPAAPRPTASLPLPGAGTSLALACVPTLIGRYFRRRQAAKVALEALRATATAATTGAAEAIARAALLEELASAQNALLSRQKEIIARLRSAKPCPPTSGPLTIAGALELLGLRTADATAIKARRKALARLYHEDAGAGSGTMMPRINAAADFLLKRP